MDPTLRRMLHFHRVGRDVMRDQLTLIKRRDRDFYLGLVGTLRPRLMLYDPRTQPTASADYVTLFDVLDGRVRYERKEAIAGSLEDASRTPSKTLHAAIDTYCVFAKIDPEQEWADNRRRAAGLRGSVCRFADLQRRPEPFTYEDLLNTFEWLDRREVILKRDGSRCARCASAGSFSAESSGVQVHHLYYVRNRTPWDYPDDALVTLCVECHQHLHETEEVPVYDDKGGSLVASNVIPCPRCRGAGFFPEYLHVEEGICFRCRGARFELRNGESQAESIR